MEQAHQTHMEYQLENSIFGLNLHYLREKCGQTVPFFASYLWMTPEKLERIERGDLEVVDPAIIYWTSKYFDIEEEKLLTTDLRA